jgi:DegV family protein with EDD domain
MEDVLKKAFVAGYERLLAWTDLLDEINVFPVADGDTGQNLKLSLLPLGRMDQDTEALGRDLIAGAVGNSGNIAAAFFFELLQIMSQAGLKRAVLNGKEQALQAVADPQPGTMLTVYDQMATVLHSDGGGLLTERFGTIIDDLADAVAATMAMQPSLQSAGVVDAGALGMFIYLEAFLGRLSGVDRHFCDISKRFAGKLRIKNLSSSAGDADGICVSALIRPIESNCRVRESLSNCAKSVVVGVQKDCMKVHLHTRHPEKVQEQIATMGEVVKWSQEVIQTQSKQSPPRNSKIHVMTDAAGSMTREDAEELNVTLLDSCIVMDGRKFPETLLRPETVYAAMAKGSKVSTTQTSLFQRRQAYESAVSRYEKVLYLCVGSHYTGNYNCASAFLNQNGVKDRFTVLDTGAASGRLGIIARQTAIYAKKNPSMKKVLAFARKAMDASCEYVFLDQLKYLSAGGRISKTRGFIGDLLGIKPIVTPCPDGAVKAGTARSRKDQLIFAAKKIRDEFNQKDAPHILLQFSDNYAWVQDEVAPQIKFLLPEADILLRPLSLTSGAHMGPGTWSMAYLTCQTTS